MRPKVSVAMATYNGERFILEQLKSLANQDRLPDELIICDDESTDATISIVHEFKKTAPFKVVLYSNKKNIGVTPNFEKAISLCTGDLIFVCDQDDIWLPSKVRIMEEIFDLNESTQVAINDCLLVSQDLGEAYGSLMARTKTYKGNVSEFISGCCTVIRGSFRDLLLPIPVGESGKIGYDEWLHFVATLVGVRKVENIVLQYYRRHDSNASNSKENDLELNRFSKLGYYTHKLFSSIEQREKHNNWLILRHNHVSLVLDRLKLKNIFSNEEFWLKKISELKITKISFEKRVEIVGMYRSRRIIEALKLYFSGGYAYFSGWKSLVIDILK